MIVLACPHGLRITDDSEPRSPKYQTEWLRALLLACPACDAGSRGFIEPEPEPESAHEVVSQMAGVGTQIVEPEVEDDEPDQIDLDEIDAELDAEEEKPPAEEPKRKRTIEKRGPDGLLPKERRVLDFIRAEGDVTPKALRREFGINPEQSKRITRALIERGLIVGIGERAARYFRAARQPSEHRQRTEAGKQRAAEAEAARIAAVKERATQQAAATSDPKKQLAAAKAAAEIDAGDVFRGEYSQVRQNGVGTPEGRVLQAVRYRAGSIKQLAERLSLPSDEVALAVRKLDREGEVRSRVDGGQVVWCAR